MSRCATVAAVEICVIMQGAGQQVQYFVFIYNLFHFKILSGNCNMVKSVRLLIYKIS